jgi:hypothetical protein
VPMPMINVDCVRRFTHDITQIFDCFHL